MALTDVPVQSGLADDDQVLTGDSRGELLTQPELGQSIAVGGRGVHERAAGFVVGHQEVTSSVVIDRIPPGKGAESQRGDRETGGTEPALTHGSYGIHPGQGRDPAPRGGRR